MSHHTARGSDEESDSEGSQKSLPPPPLSSSSPASHPHTLTSHTLTTLPAPPSGPGTGELSLASLSGNLANQMTDKITGVGRGRSSRQIRMQRGKCLGEPWMQ